MDAEEIGLLLKQERGQFLEFVSAYEYRRGGTQKKRDEDLAREIVRVLSGMANADGGTLLVGVEPDRSVTGLPHDLNEVQSLIQAPQTLLTPPLSLASAKIRLGNLLLIKFEVASALEVYRVTGGRSFYRISTETPSLPAEQIQTLREAKRSVLYERQQPLNVGWDDLDQTAIAGLTARIQDSRPPEAVLARTYHLVDTSRRPPTPNRAGLLLFAKDPAFWHPRCGIDFVKYEGTERQHGASLNVVKRIRFEAPLVRLIDEAVGESRNMSGADRAARPFSGAARVSHFAWQEALVNAVAYRIMASPARPSRSGCSMIGSKCAAPVFRPRP
jgi:ATP-dependent DNA helicase RecG